MNNKLLLCLVLLLCVTFQKSYGMQTPPIELTAANLATDYSFIIIKATHIPKPGNESDFFTVIVTPKEGHKPKNFEGRLEICDKEKLICGTQVIPHGRGDKSISFSFQVSSDFLATSGFSLVEPLHVLEDNPTTYHFYLKDFAGSK
jgi:hypothetical protein